MTDFSLFYTDVSQASRAFNNNYKLFACLAGKEVRTFELPSTTFSAPFLWISRKLGDGLFLKCCGEVSRDYPNIEYNSMIIDNCCMQVKY